MKGGNDIYLKNFAILDKYTTRYSYHEQDIGTFSHFAWTGYINQQGISSLTLNAPISTFHKNIFFFFASISLKIRICKNTLLVRANCVALCTWTMLLNELIIVD